MKFKRIKYLLLATFFICTFFINVASQVANAAEAAEAEKVEEVILNTNTFYTDIIEGEIKYIKSLMMSNGAISNNPAKISSQFSNKDLPDVDGFSADIYTKWRVGYTVPYFAELAVMGLLKTAPNESKEIAENFITWYLDSLNNAESDIHNVDGTIYDMYIFENPVNKDEVVQLPARIVRMDEFDNPKDNNIDYDSTDSYAALLLRILCEYYTVYDSSEIFVDRKDDVDRVVNALFSTYVDEINLTYAKPSYKVCYLMDNCEVYNGLISSAVLYKEVFNDEEKAKELSEYADKVKDAIEEYMWNEQEGVYLPAVFTNGKPTTTLDELDLTLFYPNATAQLFPILFELIDSKSERAVKIYENFNENFGLSGVSSKDWVALDKGDVYPWCTIAHVAGIMDDFQRLDNFMVNLKRKHLLTHNHPYYSAESGHTLSAIYYMLSPKYIADIAEVNITANVGDEIDLGVQLYPMSASVNKLNVKIKDSSIAEFDQKIGFVKALTCGQTVITLSVQDADIKDKNEFIIILNIVNPNEPAGDTSTLKPGKNKHDIITAAILGSIVILSGAVALFIFLSKGKKKD